MGPAKAEGIEQAGEIVGEIGDLRLRIVRGRSTVA